MEFDAKYVKCPYYIENNSEYQIKQNQIRCEGVESIGTICLVFDNRKDHIIHKRRYCYDIEGYHDCPICKLLDDKWEVNR